MAAENPTTWGEVLPALAGVAGSIVSLSWMPGSTWASKAANAISGTFAAFFVGPWVTELLPEPTLRAGMGVGFIIGCFGVALGDIMIRQARELPIAKMIAERFQK
jgi:hypothetical protein